LCGPVHAALFLPQSNLIMSATSTGIMDIGLSWLQSPNGPLFKHNMIM
jgi:hypothetical protein